MRRGFNISGNRWHREQIAFELMHNGLDVRIRRGDGIHNGLPAINRDSPPGSGQCLGCGKNSCNSNGKMVVSLVSHTEAVPRSSGARGDKSTNIKQHMIATQSKPSACMERAGAAASAGG